MGVSTSDGSKATGPFWLIGLTSFEIVYCDATLDIDAIFATLGSLNVLPCIPSGRIFSERTIKNAFKKAEIIPFNPDHVLSKLVVTPSPPRSPHGQNQESSLI